jgi:hypothetical protein
MTFVPVNIEKVNKDETTQSVKRWITKEGWSYPGVKSSQQSNEHPRKLDQASLDKLKEVKFIIDQQFLNLKGFQFKNCLYSELGR